MFSTRTLTLGRFLVLFKNNSTRSVQRVVGLTENNYKVRRKNFNELNENHVQYFRSLLGDHRVVRDPSDLEKNNVDWMNLVRGNSALMVKPRSTEEVSEIMKYCNEKRLAVCPQSGNTSIVGGAVPVFDEVVLSMELMNEILSLDENSGVMVCQSGCILETLDAKLAEKGLIVPLDLGAKGSCMIGGNVSTNAGGLRLLKYGNLHGSVLGIEAVTGTGQVIDCMSTLKKDNTGYHLKHMFIGSEGTLGVVTKVAFQCPSRPTSVNVAFLGLQNYENVLKVFRKAKQDLGEILSAFEVMDAESLVFLKEKLGMSSPIGEYPFYLLIETSGSDQTHDSEKLNKFLETAFEEETVVNGTVATEPTKVNAIWDVRERIPHGFKMCKVIVCYDFSLPLDKFYVLVDKMRIHMGDRAQRVFGFGHLGDGNLHLQIELDELTEEIKKHVEPNIFERVQAYGGSISAEHGMGFLKANYLPLTRSPNTVKLMEDLKQLFDPNGILNPYKMFPWKG